MYTLRIASRSIAAARGSVEAAVLVSIADGTEAVDETTGDTVRTDVASSTVPVGAGTGVASALGASSDTDEVPLPSDCRREASRFLYSAKERRLGGGGGGVGSRAGGVGSRGGGGGGAGTAGAGAGEGNTVVSASCVATTGLGLLSALGVASGGVVEDACGGRVVGDTRRTGAVMSKAFGGVDGLRGAAVLGRGFGRDSGDLGGPCRDTDK